MMKWLGSSSEPKERQDSDEIDGQYLSRSGRTVEPETAHERGDLHFAQGHSLNPADQSFCAWYCMYMLPQSESNMIIPRR